MDSDDFKIKGFAKAPPGSPPSSEDGGVGTSGKPFVCKMGPPSGPDNLPPPPPPGFPPKKKRKKGGRRRKGGRYTPKQNRGSDSKQLGDDTVEPERGRS